MNGIDHTFPVSEEVTHKLDEVREAIETPVREARALISGSRQKMNFIAVAVGLIALIVWARD
jgi:hypothetical protein